MSREEKILNQTKSILLTVRNTVDTKLEEVDNLLEKVASSSAGKSRRNKKSLRVAGFDDKSWSKPKSK
jgi:hypothetical protein